MILRCYFIDHLKMTPSFSSPHYPLRSRYTLSMCVTSSFQLFPPFTAILISFSWDVPVFNHLRWRVTKTSLDHHDFYFLPLPAPKSVQYTVNFASQVRTNTVCYTLTLNSGFPVSINLGGKLYWDIVLSWCCTAITALLFHNAPNISCLHFWGPNFLMNKTSSLWHSCSEIYSSSFTNVRF